VRVMLRLGEVIPASSLVAASYSRRVVDAETYTETHYDYWRYTEILGPPLAKFDIHGLLLDKESKIIQHRGPEPVQGDRYGSYGLPGQMSYISV
jgi:hypothetical protein